MLYGCMCDVVWMYVCVDVCVMLYGCMCGCMCDGVWMYV